MSKVHMIRYKEQNYVYDCLIYRPILQLCACAEKDQKKTNQTEYKSLRGVSIQ